MARVSGSQTVTIKAPANVVLAILQDMPGQTKWFPGMLKAEVLETDANGLCTKAHQLTDVKVAKDEFDMAFVHNPNGMSWSLASDSKMQKSNSGSWTVKDNGNGTTDATMALDIDASLPLPSFVMKKTLKDTLKGATGGLKNTAER